MPFDVLLKSEAGNNHEEDCAGVRCSTTFLAKRHFQEI